MIAEALQCLSLGLGPEWVVIGPLAVWGVVAAIGAIAGFLAPADPPVPRGFEGG